MCVLVPADKSLFDHKVVLFYARDMADLARSIAAR